MVSTLYAKAMEQSFYLATEWYRALVGCQINYKLTLFLRLVFLRLGSNEMGGVRF